MRRALIIASIFVASCGGGSSDAPPPPPPPPLAPEGLIDLALARGVFDVSSDGDGGDSSGDGGVGGAAGDGAPLGRTVVFLTDSQGKTVTGQTDAKGGYLLRFKTADFKAPFVLKVVDAGGSILASANEIVIPAGKAARVNINPLTDKVVSDVLPAATSGTDKVFDGASVNTAGLVQAKTNLLTSIQAALVVAGVPDSTQFDPVRSAYKHDGTGVDAIIESISHVRLPGTGATQLQAKLAPLVTNADGTVVPTVISASTPLATTQVAIASNPALTFSKITAWVDFVNSCLAISPVRSGDCSDANFFKTISPAFNHNSKDFQEEFRTLLSETDGSGVNGSVLRNPNVLFIGRYSDSTIDDLAVVEVTIRQPRTGPLAGNTPTPIEYTKTLVFKRDDTTTGLKAGNWVLYGNQRNFNWSIEPLYFSTFQLNAVRNVNTAGGEASFMKSGLRMNFSTRVFSSLGSRGYVSANISAVRFKGPGLPDAGLVFAPEVGDTGRLTLLNKTGALPAAGTTSNNVRSDFRMSGVVLPSGAPIDVSQWPGTPANAEQSSYSAHADSPTSTDLSRLQAFTSYAAEIFIGGSTTPIIETTRILAPVQTASTVAKIPFHDLTPSASQIVPPQIELASVNVQWVRTPGAIRIESAFVTHGPGVIVSRSKNVADAFSLAPSSTSVVIGEALPARATAVYREIGLTGQAGRSQYQHSIRYTP